MFLVTASFFLIISASLINDVTAPFPNSNEGESNNTPTVLVELIPPSSSNATNIHFGDDWNEDYSYRLFGELDELSVPYNITFLNTGHSMAACLPSSVAGPSGRSQAGSSGLGGSTCISGIASIGKKIPKNQCNVCGSTFANAYNLKRHKLTHTDDKLYACDYLGCDKTFAQKCNLKRHKLTHTGEKPHKCDTCNETFALASSLKKHQLTHTGKKPHKCETCGKTFSQSCNLKRHKKSHHKNDSKKPRLEEF